MAELNLKQITDKLNSEFDCDSRKIVFWYDGKEEFKDEIEFLELENAKIWHLEKDNQFYTKYHLEYEDTETNYLIYAPFAKPDIRENYLIDMLLYSKEFYADRASLICVDLRIDEEYKAVIQQHINFFASKDRYSKFVELSIEEYNKKNIELAMLSVICKNKTISFDEILTKVIIDGELDENKYLSDFEKYDLLDAFWENISSEFAYKSLNPTLEKFLMSLFITCAARTMHYSTPEAWKPMVLYQVNNAMVFIENLMNNSNYASKYDAISHKIFKLIDGEKVLANVGIEALIDCNLFAEVDEKIIKILTEKLLQEDIGLKINNKNIPQICKGRKKTHFGKHYISEYYVIFNAFYIISEAHYKNVNGVDLIIENYLKHYYKIDNNYRYFYYHYDKLEDCINFEKLRDLIENIYVNDYLNNITVDWSTDFIKAKGKTNLMLQRDFYNNYVKTAKDRVVVIISDAMRYEVAYTLYKKFIADEKCDAKIDALQGVLPSYTPLGMAALLPHRTLEYNDNFEVLIDEKPCASTEQRQKILQSYNPNSKCIQFDLVKNMKRNDLRDVFTGQEVVYIYHNQIDVHGDDPKTEDEIFIACEDAINEIYTFIKKVASQANTLHFIITADHGFIYKRDKIAENDKIFIGANQENNVGQRYILSKKDIGIPSGIGSIDLTTSLGVEDRRLVSFPLASDIFKVSGAGQNYIHGGCSPQEMLVPCLDVKVEKSKAEITTAAISLLSVSTKITNLITNLEFLQSEPVSDVVKKTTYKIYFMSEDNEIISNEAILNADRKDLDSRNRIFNIRFNFKNKQYDKSKKHYLVVINEQTGMEVFRREFIVDIIFADDFGF